MSIPFREAGLGPHRPFESVSTVHPIALMSTYTLPSTMTSDRQHLCLPPTLGLPGEFPYFFNIESKHVTNSLLLVLPLLSVRQLVSFAHSRQSAMESSEPLSAAHKTPARARFKPRGRFSTHRNQLGLRKNQSVLLDSPSIPVPLFVSIDCHSLKMSNPYERTLVSVYNPVFRRPETHLVNVAWPIPISEF